MHEPTMSEAPSYKERSGQGLIKEKTESEEEDEDYEDFEDVDFEHQQIRISILGRVTMLFIFQVTLCYLVFREAYKSIEEIT